MASGTGQSDEDTDLLELAGYIWRKKIWVFVAVFLAALVAGYVSFFVLPVTYQSQAALIQISSDSSKMGGLSKLGGLASLAGSLPIPISLPGGAGEQLLIFLQSRNLKIKLIEKYDLLPRLYKDLWDPQKKVWLVDTPAEKPTTTRALQKEKLKDIFLVSQDEKTQLITISWIDEDPAFAAEMLKRVISELDYYLTHEYVSDAKRERLFVEKQLDDITRELEKWEKELPSTDLTLTKIAREKLAAQEVYAELRKQVELARFTEEKEVINFKVIDPPYVPEEIFEPRRIIICGVSLVAAAGLMVFSLIVHYWISVQRGTRKNQLGSVPASA